MEVEGRLHPWAVTPKQAAGIQRELRVRLDLTWDERHVSTVAGIDVSVVRNLSRAAVVVLGFPDLRPRANATAEMKTVFPYVPGLLSFREGPVILAAWEKLDPKPDLVLFDGHGTAHPRGMGIAAHMGLWLDVPTIGVAKSRLCGVVMEPGSRRGAVADLLDEADPRRVLGAVVRTKDGTHPVFVSPGHRMDLVHAVGFVLRCVGSHRLPEPIRWAHHVAGGGSLPAAQPG
ncbi:MAG: deoxyribonuclease V [Candidatus Bipolaricaulis sp.]|nr:deoxyribonuclease V [Candidatus Bipolaricaulis sp.]MDD5219240.1 deoxyribonuclease V [Candidatus Bipolaricaulis sp.]